VSVVRRRKGMMIAYRLGLNEQGELAIWRSTSVSSDNECGGMERGHRQDSPTAQQ